MARVLVVDDDQDVQLVLGRYLERDGHEVASALTAQAALAHLVSPGSIDIAILDLTLPDMDGLQVLSRIRASKPDLPVLVLTARGDEGDRILGLGLGADDYVVKPFSPRELCLRIAALLRRARGTGPTDDGPIRFGSIEMRVTEHRVALDGHDIELTPKEFDLLHMFLRNPRRVLSKSAILSALWPEGYVSDHVIDVHLASLRRKLGGALEIATVRGIGYRLGGGA